MQRVYVCIHAWLACILLYLVCACMHVRSHNIIVVKLLINRLYELLWITTLRTVHLYVPLQVDALVQDSEGKTCLHWAAESRYPSASLCVQLLCRKYKDLVETKVYKAKTYFFKPVMSVYGLDMEVHNISNYHVFVKNKLCP